MIRSTTAPWCGLTVLWLTSPAWTRQLDRRDSLKLHKGAELSPGEEGAGDADINELVGGGSQQARLLVGAASPGCKLPEPRPLRIPQQLARHWACSRCLINAQALMEREVRHYDHWPPPLHSPA